MTKLVDIKTFYRPNSDMIELLEKHMFKICDINGHRFTAAFLPIIQVKKFAAVNDGCVFAERTYEQVTGRKSSTYKDEMDFIFIGVSLAEITQEDFEKLKFHAPWSFEMGYEFNPRKTYAATKNPNLFLVDNTTYFFKKEKVIPAKEVAGTTLAGIVNPVEVQFIESLNGFDFWYSYSDSLSVYRAGEARQKEIIEKGVIMGLTKKRAEELYTLVYQSSI